MTAAGYALDRLQIEIETRDARTMARASERYRFADAGARANHGGDSSSQIKEVAFHQRSPRASIVGVGARRRRAPTNSVGTISIARPNASAAAIKPNIGGVKPAIG